MTGKGHLTLWQSTKQVGRVGWHHNEVSRLPTPAKQRAQAPVWPVPTSASCLSGHHVVQMASSQTYRDRQSQGHKGCLWSPDLLSYAAKTCLALHFANYYCSWHLHIGYYQNKTWPSLPSNCINAGQHINKCIAQIHIHKSLVTPMSAFHYWLLGLYLLNK